MIFVHIVRIQSKYVQNQVVYYFGNSIYNLELFWIKKNLVSTINTMGGTLCGGIISERSKI